MVISSASPASTNETSLERLLKDVIVQLELQKLAEQIVDLLPKLDHSFQEWQEDNPAIAQEPISPSSFLERVLEDIPKTNPTQEQDKYVVYQYEKKIAQPDNKEPEKVYYYIPPHNRYAEHKQEMYLFTSTTFTVMRVPQAELGENVLGSAYPGRGLIKVLDSLTGTAFQEVLRHEINHLTFPLLTEDAIRYMTRNQLPFEPHYH